MISYYKQKVAKPFYKDLFWKCYELADMIHYAFLILPKFITLAKFITVYPLTISDIDNFGSYSNCIY